ncbi:MAG: gamma-glutamyltransferase, partial [Gemmatimonadetes bacterium]|nr:gamma-glutamyltransferase [Gemmatimonadota bacterium]NIR81482.1 gamma-glutamyltransferase [Gemmatimonadota bacterium]NIT90329.1 gamma-glutamyltransferase [Gemmatimonadota bacterium]NIU34154.1 gamma-glutamyltransferase [Gemmatimonadota bacterium]NIU38305.1 gamma-glutamyltransferase [Gemmatimonadota bacterium]
YDVLRRGGNATDAVVAMAGVLAVVRPHMNGVGGDAFALFYDGESGGVTALNGSGRAGELATRRFFLERGHEEIPETGPLSVSVPGAVAAWLDALERHGTMERAEVLEYAVGYARGGFPVSSRLRRDFQAQSSALDEAGRALYLPGGKPPPAGSLLRNPALASTLERVAREGVAGFYGGPVARRLDAFFRENGGYLRAGDLASHTSTWVDPLTADYLGHRLHVLPPNTQGVAQLQLAKMANSFELREMGHNTSTYLHTLIELKKLAFADRNRWVADPTHAEIPLDRLLDPSYLAGRAERVDPARAAGDVPPGIGSADEGDGAGTGMDDGGDTVYITAVDRWGNAVSWIQSLFHGFGSGVFDPETGILFQNRGALFTLEPDHPNVVAPGKRPYHTLTPLLATREGNLGFTLGTPGGDSQTQSLLQIMNNLLLFGMTPQEAIEAPRFRSYPGRSVAVEDRISPEVRAELESLGHEVRVIHGWTATFGGAHMIRLDPEEGTLIVAADPRREGYSLAY